jgi:hypothetical protein
MQGIRAKTKIPGKFRADTDSIPTTNSGWVQFLFQNESSNDVICLWAGPCCNLRDHQKCTTDFNTRINTPTKRRRNTIRAMRNLANIPERTLQLQDSQGVPDQSWKNHQLLIGIRVGI